MIYENMCPGTFLDRPNRFIAHVELRGNRETVHVKNTGRCRELLVSGAEVWCQESRNPARKTKWDLICVRKGAYLVNMDSQAPFLEVKGVTLEEGGVCAFPDAPTERGTKHLRGLLEAVKAGYGAYVLFVIQMRPVKCFRPQQERDPAFAKALREAAAGGVEVLAMDCDITPEEMRIREPVPVEL